MFSVTVYLCDIAKKNKNENSFMSKYYVAFS